MKEQSNKEAGFQAPQTSTLHLAPAVLGTTNTWQFQGNGFFHMSHQTLHLPAPFPYNCCRLSLTFAIPISSAGLKAWMNFASLVFIIWVTWITVFIFYYFFFYVFSFFLVPHRCLPHYLSHNTCLQTPFYSLSIRITSKQISQVTSESGACCYLSLQAEDPPPERSGHSPGVK